MALLHVDRRQFIRFGLAGLATVSLVRFGRAAAPAGVLTGDDRRRLGAIARGLLGSALPSGGGAKVVTAIDGIIANLPPATQAELRDLFDLIGFAPARLALTGAWSDWDARPTPEIDSALEGWRTSRFALLRSAYAGLHELVMAGWYGDPAAWARIGYDGPPDVPRPAAVREEAK